LFGKKNVDKVREKEKMAVGHRRFMYHGICCEVYSDERHESEQSIDNGGDISRENSNYI
jgi:hypothetical protein